MTRTLNNFPLRSVCIIIEKKPIRVQKSLNLETCHIGLVERIDDYKERFDFYCQWNWERPQEGVVSDEDWTEDVRYFEGLGESHITE